MTTDDAAAGVHLVHRKETTERISLFVAAAILSKRFLQLRTEF
jgi:hypothetical protein